MSLSKRDLSEFMIAKLIHDIAGPVGAVSNGIEYLDGDDTPIKEQALTLVKESSQHLMARVQFYRIAYGYIYLTTEISIAHLKQLATQFFENGKVTLVWDNAYTDACGIPLSNKLGKLTLNLLLMCAACLLEGGTITVMLERVNGGKQISVIGKGSKILVKPEWRYILLQDDYAGDVDTKNIQLYYTRQLIKDCQVELAMNHTAEEIALKATYNAV